MTPGPSKDIWCHIWPLFFLCLQITRSHIIPQIKWTVSLVIAGGRFNLPRGFVWVCMGKQTHLITPECTRMWSCSYIAHIYIHTRRNQCSSVKECTTCDQFLPEVTPNVSMRLHSYNAESTAAWFIHGRYFTTSYFTVQLYSVQSYFTVQLYFRVQSFYSSVIFSLVKCHRSSHIQFSHMS